ncbi:MAG TPA: ABC transporter substrate-binding protein [Terracidiphilus sp.]|jgi:peptide/nickel transport system substrate-binding protein|nr:ABC transporter substrate-binding protein [Terracidiphilus sp.]
MRWTVLRHFAISCLLVATTLQVAARTRPHYGGTLRVETAGDPWQKPDGVARRFVFDGLTTFDARGAVRPALATDWASDDADHRWQFRLRPGVHFHDGTLLTSVNVVASLNIACPQNCPWTAIHAVGPYVVFTADSPMPNLPALLATDEFLVALTISSDGKTPPATIGTGPFQFMGAKGGVLSFTAYESCWQGRPFVDVIEVRVNRSVRDQWLDLGVTKADVVDVPVESLHMAQQQRLDVTVSAPVQLLVLQVSDAAPLANPLLRSAISSAVDRIALANVVFQKQAQVSASLLPQMLTGYGFLFPTERDLNKARSLRGGLPSPQLTLRAEGDGAMQLAAQRIALDLHEAGFNVQVVRPDAARANLTLRLLPLEGSSPEAVLDVLLRRAGISIPTIGDDSAALYKAERAILDQHTLIPLLDLPAGSASSSRVRDLHLRADGAPDLAGVSLGDAP